MKTIPLPHGRHVAVDDDDFEFLSRHRWNTDADGYVRRVINKNKKYTTEIMHRLIMGLQQGDPRKVDHISGDKLDNRKQNLRVCTHAENLRNRGKQSDNTSGFKGVSFHKDSSRWCATITADGKQKHLGLYTTPEEAFEVYCLWVDMLHGEFANYGV